MLIEKRRQSRMVGLVLGIVFLVSIIGMVGHASEQMEADKAEQMINSYMLEKKVNYTNSQVVDKVLTVEMVSNGKGRSTVEDIKSVRAIYEAVYSGEYVEGLNITIRDADGEVIMDMSQPNIAAKTISRNSLSTAEKATEDKIVDDVM